MLFALLKGLLFGLYVGVPTGPVGALCIARVLDRGFWSGIWTGAGSVLSDIVYALVFVFGLRQISDFFTIEATLLRIGGGVLLLGIGVFLFFQKTKKQDLRVKKHVHGGDFLSGFFITLSNPIQIVSYSVFFVALKITQFSGIDSVMFIVGIFLATSAWWVVLSWFVSRFKKGLSEKTIRILHRIIACIVIAVGAVVIASSLF